ncbi:MAG: hypothetical protein AAF934_09515 [Bacteroidota bacterium]
MKDTIVSIFFSNGDSLKIDLAEEGKENTSDANILPEKTAPQNRQHKKKKTH